MKRVAPRVATPVSIMSGQVVYVANDPSVSVMLTDPHKWRTLYIPAPRLPPFDSWVTEGAIEKQIEPDGF
jgi:hypothetical protein